MTAPESTTSARITEGAERQKQAVALRIAGATFAQIGDRLGVTAQAAHKMVVKALADTAKKTAESAEQLRQMELQRLDALQASLWPDAMRGDEQKVDRVIKIMARRAALMGLDAPTKQEVQQTVTNVNIRYTDSDGNSPAPSPSPEEDQAGAR